MGNRAEELNDGIEPDDTEPKQDKPRGKCTGCAFDYQLGTARTGEHKGELVIRKHNSRTGPGLCSGASVPPEPMHTEREEAERNTARVRGSAYSSTAGDEFRLPVPESAHSAAQPGEYVVGVVPGGIPIVADPWTAPLKTSDQEDAEEPQYTATAHAADTAGGIAVTGTAPLPPGEAVVDLAPPRVVQSGPYAGAVVTVTDPNASRYEQDDNPGTVTSALFTAPAPASDIPESTTTVSGQQEPDRDRWGRYMIMGSPHTRATTFAKLGANTKAIEAWNERNVIRGLTLRPDLLMLANGLEVKRDRNDLNSIAAQAKDAAGSKVAANIGTAYHAFTERIDARLMTLQQVPSQYMRRVRQYSDALSRAGLTTRPEWIERTTAVRADQVGAPLPVAGTLDRIFQLPDGSLVIGDLKTGSDLSYGEMEIEVQLALYAHGVNTHGLFDWNFKAWDQGNGEHPLGSGLLKVRTDIAIVVHLPADGDGCTLYVADIERGWRDAQRLGPLQASLKEKKRFRTLLAADLAPRTVKELPAQPSPDQADANDAWGWAKHLISTAETQARIAELYQSFLDSGLFHTDQTAVLVGLGKDRLNALAKG